MSVLALNDFYRGVVESLGFAVRGGRVISIDKDGEEDVTIEGKFLVLPDDKFLKNPNWETEVPFHPLCENPHRGESDVVKMVLETAVANLNVSLLGLTVHLFADVVCIDDTKRLSTEQAELLTFVSNAGKNTKKAIIGMVKYFSTNPDAEPLIKCNLRRRCPLGDERFERVCVVRFPFAEMDRKDNPYGLKTNSEMDALRGLLDFILPGWENDDSWSVGTNTFTAPYFTSILMMYGKLGTRLNQVIDLYKDLVPSLEDYRIQGIEYVMEKLNTEGYAKSLSESIPALGDSNKGSIETKKAPETGYAVEQPKQAVSLPWDAPSEQVEREQNQGGVAPRTPEGTASYVPGTVVPTANPVNALLATALAASGGMLQGLVPQAQQVIDTSTFHGRQLAKQALLTPLGTQQSMINNQFGTSPFLETNQQSSGGATYTPGSVTGRAPQPQSQSLHHHQPVGQRPLGF